jgi:Glycine cleavage system protein P (pyridoxal-binding), N-terminal domain
MIIDLTALDIANASMLDEATAAAEAMALCHAVFQIGRRSLLPIIVIPKRLPSFKPARSRSGSRSRSAITRDSNSTAQFFGALVQYPATDGAIYDYAEFVRKAHDAGALVVVAADILALTLLKPPGDFGADVAVGNTQRFGVPLGFGGRTRRTSPRAMNSNVTCLADWWAFHTTLKVDLRIASLANARATHPPRQSDQ